MEPADGGQQAHEGKEGQQPSIPFQVASGIRSGGKGPTQVAAGNLLKFGAFPVRINIFCRGRLTGPGFGVSWEWGFPRKGRFSAF
jgi:hypothetical protein